MATAQGNSLLGLPAELRARIYRHLFPETCIRLRMVEVIGEREDELVSETEPALASETPVDNGITLVSRLLRAESLPVVRQSLTLYCDIEEESCGRANLCIKTEYRQYIYRAQFTFCTVRFEIPFLDALPSLDTVHFECSKSWVPMAIVLQDLKEFSECALSGDIRRYVKFVKSQIEEETEGTSLYGILQDENRGFKIRWRDQASMVKVNMRFNVLWFAFDWDALEVFEGASGMLREYQRGIVE